MEVKEKKMISIPEETWKYQRKKNRIHFVLMIIFLAISVFIFIEGYSFHGLFEIKEEITTGLNDDVTMPDTSKQECDTDSILILSLNKFFELEGGFLFKFLLFLGVIYLIQILFTLSFDIIEIVIISCLFISKLFKWIVSKFKK